jgi:hypothetical protein
MNAEQTADHGRKRVSGGILTFVGACIALLGAAISAVGALKSSHDNRTKSDALAAKSDEIARLNAEIADRSKKLTEYVTGADSFIYLHVFDFGQDSLVPRVVHTGANPVRDTEITIFDVSNQAADLSSGRSKNFDVDRDPKYRDTVGASFPEQPLKVLGNTFEKSPQRDSYSYFVYLNGGSGTYRQIFQFVKVQGSWRQAYLVERVPYGEPREVIGAYFDAGFPEKGDVFLRRKANTPRLDAPERKRPRPKA